MLIYFKQQHFNAFFLTFQLKLIFILSARILVCFPLREYVFAFEHFLFI